MSTSTLRVHRDEATYPSSPVTICICTRNRPESLRKTLESIRRSPLPVAQVVVSDDSTDERTLDLVSCGYPEVVYRRGPRRGLGANRNAAVDAATEDTILFLDDDCLLGEDFMQSALAELQATRDPDRTIVNGGETNAGHLVRSADQSFLGFQNQVYGPTDTVYSVVINATLFPRALFDDVRFDEQLIYGCDEVDLTTRAVAVGYRIVSSETAINHHHPSPVNRDYYAAHANSARLYVTFKRYRWTERRPVKGYVFLAVAVVHLFASMLKEQGLRGLCAASGVVWEAVRSIRRWAASQ